MKPLARISKGPAVQGQAGQMDGLPIGVGFCASDLDLDAQLAAQHLGDQGQSPHQRIFSSCQPPKKEACGDPTTGPLHAPLWVKKGLVKPVAADVDHFGLNLVTVTGMPRPRRTVAMPHPR
jgi:hypothetical protein